MPDLVAPALALACTAERVARPCTAGRPSTAEPVARASTAGRDFPGRGAGADGTGALRRGSSQDTCSPPHLSRRPGHFHRPGRARSTGRGGASARALGPPAAPSLVGPLLPGANILGAPLIAAPAPSHPPTPARPLHRITRTPPQPLHARDLACISTSTRQSLRPRDTLRASNSGAATSPARGAGAGGHGKQREDPGLARSRPLVPPLRIHRLGESTTSIPTDGAASTCPGRTRVAGTRCPPAPVPRPMHPSPALPTHAKRPSPTPSPEPREPSP